MDMHRLPMWVVYDHPKDWPDFYVARLLYSLPEPAATDFVILCTQIEDLRMCMLNRCCTKLDRDPADDPVIMETWIV